MHRAIEALGLPEDMRTPIGQIKMHPIQVVMIEFVEPNINRLRAAYMAEMEQTGLHRLFSMAPQEAFENYQQERAEYREALHGIGRLEEFLESLEHARN